MISGAVVLVIAFVIGIMQSNPANSAPRLNEGAVKSLVLEQYPGEVKQVKQSQSKKDAIYTVDLTFEGKDYAVQVDGNAGNIIHVKELSPQVAMGDGSDAHKDMLEKAEDKQPANDKKPDSNKEKPQKEEPKKDETVKKDNPKKSEEEKPKETNKNKDKQPGKKTESNQSSTILSEIEAIQIAQKEFPGVVLEIEREKNNGRTIFEIKLVANGEKAELELDAMSGKIDAIQVESDKEADRKYSGVPLSMVEAIQIAQGKFKGAVIDAELDLDDGRYEYEMKLVGNGTKVEITVDGKTGDIIEYDVD